MFTEAQVAEYTAGLYKRRYTGVRVRSFRVICADWQPRPNYCHTNVTEFCQRNSDYTPVRGWLYFDYCEALDYVKFLAHSVIRTPDAELTDITPSNRERPDPYPFIEALLTDEDFYAMLEHTEEENLVYYTRQRNSA